MAYNYGRGGIVFMNSKKPRVGLMTLCIPVKFSPLPKEAFDIIDNYAKKAQKYLASNMLDVIRIEEIVEDSRTAVEKAKYLSEKEIHCLIFMIGAWPLPSTAIDAIDKLDKRVSIILWGFPDLTVLSIVPTCHFHGAFDDLGIDHNFVYGNPEDKNFIETVKIAAKASQVAIDLKGMNLGLFGGRYLYMYTGMPDLVQVKKVFGVETTHIDEFWLVKEAEKIEESKIKEYSHLLHKKYKNISTPPEVETKSIRLYFSLKKFAKDYNLDFAVVKCMPEVQGDYCSHCLSVAMHIDEGMVVACEADINAALTMQILKLVSDSSPGFGDICELNRKKKTLRLANCGVFATEFASSPDEVHFMEQYDYLCPGPGTGMTTSFFAKPGKVTLARLGRIKGEYVMQISSGKALFTPRERLGEIRERYPQIIIRLDSDLEGFLQNCRSNHMHWVYGEYKEYLKKICKILGIREVVC